MDKKIEINKLFNARKLKSNVDYDQFEEALVNLQGTIQIDDVYELCKVFLDDTNDDEVMFGLIHLIEQLQGKEYLKCIAICTPDMMDAHDWAMTLNKRIINSSKYCEVYIEVINELEEPYKEKIRKLLVDIKNDNPKRFEQRQSSVIREVNFTRKLAPSISRCF